MVITFHSLWPVEEVDTSGEKTLLWYENGNGRQKEKMPGHPPAPLSLPLLLLHLLFLSCLVHEFLFFLFFFFYFDEDKRGRAVCVGWFSSSNSERDEGMSHPRRRRLAAAQISFFSHMTILTSTRRRRRYKRLQLASILSFFSNLSRLVAKVSSSFSLVTSKRESVSLNRFFFFLLPLCYTCCV